MKQQPTPDQETSESAKFLTLRVNAEAKALLQRAVRRVHAAKFSTGLRTLALTAAETPAQYPIPRQAGVFARGILEIRIYVSEEEHLQVSTAARQAGYRWTSEWLLDLFGWAVTQGPWASLERPNVGLRSIKELPMSRPAAARTPLGLVIALPQNKGGAGKSTTATNVGAELALLGYESVLVDLDPQCDLSNSLGIETDIEEDGADLDSDLPQRNLLTVLVGKKPSLLDLVVPTAWDHLSVVPGTFYMNNLESNIRGKLGVEYVVARAIEVLRDHYDFILLDCPSWMGLVTQAAIVAADYVLIPVQAQPRSLRASIRTLDIVREIQEELNSQNQPIPQLLGFVLTMVQATTVGKQACISLRRRYQDQVLTTEIQHRTRVTEDLVHKAPLWTFDPRGDATLAYRELAGELLTRIANVSNAAVGTEPKAVVAHAS